MPSLVWGQGEKACRMRAPSGGRTCRRSQLALDREDAQQLQIHSLQQAHIRLAFLADFPVVLTRDPHQMLVAACLVLSSGGKLPLIAGPAMTAAGIVQTVVIIGITCLDQNGGLVCNQKFLLQAGTKASRRNNLLDFAGRSGRIAALHATCRGPPRLLALRRVARLALHPSTTAKSINLFLRDA